MARTAPAPVAAGDAIKAYVPVTPTRMLDTRLPGAGGPLLHDETRTLRVGGTSVVPDSAVAVAMNVTVTQPSDAGYLTVWQTDAPRPATSNLNFVAGEDVPNLVTIGLSPAGDVSIYGYLYGQTGTVHVIVDVVGWYHAGFNPITPSRVMDTRGGLGGVRMAPGETRELVVQGAGNLPSYPIGAVALNVTSVDPTGVGGYLTIWPTGRDRPEASSLNFQPGEIAANAVISGVGSGGRISIYNYTGETDVLVDVTGWFSVGYEALTPFRALDTRLPGELALGPGETRILPVVGSGGVPGDGCGAVALNVTVTQPTAAGYLTIWPNGRPMPDASSLNFAAGQTIPNAVVSGVGTDGSIAIHNPFGQVHVIVDVTGWFAQSDTEPPRLRSLVLTPPAVDTSAADRQIVVRARITDDLSGNAGIDYPSSESQIRFRSPSGNQFVDALLNTSWLVSGSPFDGVYEYEMTVPRFAESGRWTVENVLLVDQVGNSRWSTGADLAAAGLPDGFQQTGAGDTEAPVLRSLALAPSSVDTSGGDRDITVTARITDNSAGNAGDGYTSSPSQIRFRSPSGNQFVDALLDGSHRIGGTARDGTYRDVMTLPRHSEQGTWVVENVLLVDQVGNMDWLTSSDLIAAGLPDRFHQTGPGDTQPPTLVSLQLSPSAVTTSAGPADITVRARITDDLAGNAGIDYPSSESQIRFRSPSGNQFIDALLHDGHRISGTSTNGLIQYVMTVPYLAESGTWTVESVLLVDQVGNTAWMTAADLVAAGLPADFTNN